MHSTTSLTTLLIAIFIAFGLGAAWKHNRLARQDLLDTKARVKRLRRFYWITTMARMIKWGLVVTLALYITAAWVQRDATDKGPTPLVPTRSVGPKPIKHPYVKKTFQRD